MPISLRISPYNLRLYLIRQVNILIIPPSFTTLILITLTLKQLGLDQLLNRLLRTVSAVLATLAVQLAIGSSRVFVALNLATLRLKVRFD